MAKTVTAAFDELLARLSLTSAQASTAQTRVSGLRDFFDSKFTMSSRAFATGSYARQTLVRWERDVDLMAPLSYSAYKAGYDHDSRAFLYMVRDALNERYGSTKVSSKQVAVKLDFTEIVADVVPCFPRQGGGFFMPNGTADWRATNPPFHAELMKQADSAQQGRLKPLVKLIKAWNLANSHHLTSFHVELMVERMWRGHTIGSHAASVASTLKVMPSWLRTAFPDPWDGGRPIDEDLSSNDRATTMRMLEADAKAAEQAIQYQSEGKVEKAFERWSVIYRQQFPAYG